MKLGTLKDGSRDGQLIVVSRDLRTATAVPDIARTLQQAVDDWRVAAPRLQEVYERLNAGKIKSFDLDTHKLAAPLPRAPQWLDGSSFHSHGDLMEKVFGLQPIEGKFQVPLMYQGASDDFYGPHDDLPFPTEADGIDFEAEVAVIVDEVSMGTPASAALQHVKLLVLVNDASLRALAPREMKTGFGFLQAKPSSSFSPVAVTPDELGGAWKDGRVQLKVNVEWNGKWFGHPHAGQMGFGFHELIAHAARARKLHAGTIIGSGTISNREYREVGSACIAERRGIELEDHGKASTPFMKFGDRVHIEMRDDAGASVFGAIDQQMVQARLP